MARVTSLWLAVVMLAPIPLAAMPTAEATHLPTVPAEDESVDFVTGMTMKIGAAAELTFTETGPDTRIYTLPVGAQDPSLSPYRGETIIKAGDTVTFTALTASGENADCGGPDNDATLATLHNVRVEPQTLFASALDGTDTADDNPSAFGTVTTVTTQDTSTAHVRTLDVVVEVEVICTVTTEIDKVNRITLQGILVDNTPPSVSAAIAPAAGTTWTNDIAKIGDRYDYTVTVNDPDFRAIAGVCDRYDFVSPNDLFGGSRGIIEHTNFPQPVCGQTATATNVQVVATTGLGYDYDGSAVVSKPNVVRIVSLGANDTAVPTASAAQPKVWAVDEYGNAAGTAIPVVKIDAVPPRALTGIGAASKPGAAIELTIPASTISTDVVRFDIEKCFPQDGACSLNAGTWTSVSSPGRSFPTPVTDPPVATVALTPRLIPADDTTRNQVALRVTAVDDAGNPSDKTFIPAIELNPQSPVFDLLTKNGEPTGTPILNGDQHPFDPFFFTVRDNKMTEPSATTASNSVAFARLWKPGPSGTDEYWSSGGSFSQSHTASAKNLQVFKVSSDSGPSAGFMTRGKFKLDLGALNSCAIAANSCIPTGTYRINFFTVDADGNIASMFPTAAGSSCYPVEVSPCTAGITLVRDTKDPTYTFTSGSACCSTKDYKNGAFNRIVPLPDLPGSPGVDLAAVQQGTFLPVSLKVLDEGAGFRNITFRFMTGSSFDRVVESTFGGPAIACLHTYNDTAAGEAHAIARIPATPNDCNLVPNAGALVAAGAPPFVVCYTTAGVQACYYETAHCYGTTPMATCSQDRTPVVNLSTDGLPFGTYKIQISTTDWSGRTKTQLMSEAVTIVPRLAIDLGSPGVQPPTKKDGKISMVMYAAYTDDQTALAACDVRGTTLVGNNVLASPFTATGLPSGVTSYFRVSAIVNGVEGPLSVAKGVAGARESLEVNPLGAPVVGTVTQSGSSATVPFSTVAGATAYKVYRVLHTPTTGPSTTGVCEPASVSIDYLPAGATPTEANYRNLKTFNAAVDKTVIVPNLGVNSFQPYGRIETPVGFYRFELKDFTPPSDVVLPEPPVLRVSVRAANVVGGIEGTSSFVRQTVTLSSSDTVSDLVPRKPFTDWTESREPTFFEAAGTAEPPAGSRLADITFETGFNPPGVAPKDTAIYYKIFDQNLNYTWQIRAVTPSSSQPATYTLPFSGATGMPAKLEDGYHYFRVTAVLASGETAFSATRVVNVGVKTVAGGSTLVVPGPSGEAAGEGAPVISDTSSNAVDSGSTVNLVWTSVPNAVAYRVYKGVDHCGLAPASTCKTYRSAADVPKTFTCNLAKPSDGERPCRMLYWADARSDAYDSKGVATGRNWIARVNVSALARIEDVNNPDDPDHAAQPIWAGHNKTATPTGARAHDREVATKTWREVNLTRGLYVLEVTAHTKSGTVVAPRDIAYLARTFRVETVGPRIVLARTTTTTIDGREWTGGSPSFEMTYDVGQFTKTTAANVSVGVQLVESSGRSWVPAPTRVRQVTLVPITVAAATTGSGVALTTATTSVDGVTLTSGMRVLVKDQSNPAENGVYTVPSTPATGTAAWTRASGARSLAELAPGLLVTVDSGTVNGRTGWMLAASTAPSTGAPTVDNTVRTFTRYTNGKDGVNLQRYNLTVDLAGYTHGTAFRLLLNLTGNNRTLVPSAFPNIRQPNVVTLDLTGPVARFDLKHKDPNGGDETSNLIDGKPVLIHGTVDDAIGSGATGVQFAAKELERGRYYDAKDKTFKSTLEGQPIWNTVTSLRDGTGTDTELVWSFVESDSKLAGMIEKEPLNYLLSVRGIDQLGNRGPVESATAILDGRPPVMSANGTALVNAADGEKAYAPRKFAINATDKGRADARAMTVNLHLLPPSGRLLTFPMKVASTSTACGFIAKDQCWAVTLDDELGWVGDVPYFFSAIDAANNTFCSYGPCDGDAAKRPALESFHLVDDGPPVIEDLVLDPKVPAAGGSVSAVAEIREAENFLAGYPKAYFYINGVEVANGTMKKLSEAAVDPASGAGFWTLSTLEVGITDLVANETLRVLVVARDASDEASDPETVSARVSANVGPIVTVVSPVPGTTNYVGKKAVVKVRVDDVNVDPTGFTVDHSVDGGAVVRDLNAANITDVRPLVTLGKTLAWEFTYRGGDFPDGKNVTFTFGARDNLTARNTTTFTAIVDGLAPTVGATVSLQASSAAGTTYVGPQTTVVLDATDAVTPREQIRIEYSVNGGSTALYSTPVGVTGGDTFTMTYAAVDLAGNRANGTALSFAIDKTPPVVAVVASGANTTITATDDLVGVDDTRVRLFYKTSTTAPQFAEFPFDHPTGNTYTATLGAVSGTFIYYVEASDKLGNVGHATVGSVTCTAETPCGLLDTGTARPVITFVSPPQGATITGPTEVKWTASAATSTPTVKLEVANSTDRLLVKGGLGLEGTTLFDPDALGLAEGDWVLILTIDDGLNVPVTASRDVSIGALVAPPKIIGPPQTPPPTGQIPAGTVYTTKMSVNDTSVSKVKATILRANAVVATQEFDVVDGSFDFRFSQSSPGTYQVRLTPVFADGTSGETTPFPGVFRVQGVGTAPADTGHLLQVSALVVVGALVVALAAVGAFKRWK